MSPVQVRLAHESDVETMAAIYVAAARKGWAHIFGERNLETVQPPVDSLRDEVTSIDPRRQVLVADSDGRLVAYDVGPRGRAGAHGVGDRDPSPERLRRGDPLDVARQPSSPPYLRSSRLDTRRHDAR
jgi:hypothetical protein